MVVIWTLIALTACSIASVTPQTVPPQTASPAPDFWGGFIQQARSGVQAIPTQFQGYWKNMQDFGTNFGSQAAQTFKSFGTQTATNARNFGTQVAQGAVDATKQAGDGFKQFSATAQNFFAQKTPTV